MAINKSPRASESGRNNDSNVGRLQLLSPLIEVLEAATRVELVEQLARAIAVGAASPQPLESADWADHASKPSKEQDHE
jgi:hypothetical protein